MTLQVTRAGLTHCTGEQHCAYVFKEPSKSWLNSADTPTQIKETPRCNANNVGHSVKALTLSLGGGGELEQPDARLLLPPLAGLCYPACKTLTPPAFPHSCLGQVPDRTPGMVLEAGSPRSGCQWARVSRGLSRGCVDGTSSMSSCVH